MPDTTTTPVAATGEASGWIPCRRCKGTGTFEWAPGKSGDCFLCEGTGDGRIRKFNGFGPRRARRYGGNGAATPAPAPAMPAPAPVPAMPMPEPAPVIAGNMTAAQHLAAALGALTPALDAEAVKRILASELSDATAKLERLIDSAVSTRAMLTEAIAGIPQRLVITWNDDMHELPAMRHHTAERLFRLVKAGKHAYVVGPAGSGKTTAARQIADSLGMQFYYQGAMSGSHCVLGYVDAYGKYHTTPTREAWEHGGVLLIDEIDGSEAEAALSIHPMDNGHMTFPDCPTPIARHPDFRLIVAANTYGRGADRLYVGRTQLDAATLNRFIFVEWNYDESLERLIAGDTDWTRYVQSARKAVDTLKIRHVISPRNAIDGNDLIALGFERPDVEAMALWQGMSDSDIARVKGAM